MVVYAQTAFYIVLVHISSANLRRDDMTSRLCDIVTVTIVQFHLYSVLTLCVRASRELISPVQIVGYLYEIGYIIHVKYGGLRPDCFLVCSVTHSFVQLTS